MASSMIIHISNLHNEILIDILARLPLQTLIKCMLVCKSWKSLLSDPLFFKLNNHYMPTSLILFSKGNIKQIFNNFFSIEKKIDSFVPINFVMNNIYNLNSNRNYLGLIPSDIQFELGNSCNGFICLTEIQTCDLSLIWNPIMHQFVILPKPTTKTMDKKVVMGFGYCSRTERYKVIRIFHMGKNPPRQEAEIYDLGVGLQWRKIGEVPFHIPSSNRGFFFNNSIHWLLLEGNNDNNNINNDIEDFNLIGGYDFVKEKFITISPPPIFKFDKMNEYYWSNLGVIGNCFSICATNATKFVIQVWVMEQYGQSDSWSIRYSIRVPSIDWFNPYKWMQVINFLEHGNISMLCSHKYVKLFSVTKQRFLVGKISLEDDYIAHVPSFISLEDVVNEHNGTGSLEVRYL